VCVCVCVCLCVVLLCWPYFVTLAGLAGVTHSYLLGCILLLAINTLEIIVYGQLALWPRGPASKGNVRIYLAIAPCINLHHLLPMY
jgi:hypothetical protein